MSTLTGDLRDHLRQELPGWLREDPDFRQWILNLTGSEYADRRETGSRFDRLLDEPRCDREAQERNREAQERSRDKQNRKSGKKLGGTGCGKSQSPRGNNGDDGSAGSQD